MKKILITLGDPNGIGSEIIFKSLSMLSENNRKNIELIGYKSSWNYSVPDIVFHNIDSSYNIKMGKISPYAGEIALKSLDKAISLLKTNKYSGLVTGPISKEAIVLSGQSNFRGHTDYLAEAFNSQTEMVFWSKKWSVLLATIHIALKDVPSFITPNRLEEAIKNAIKFHQQFHQNGLIAVCGLNPHAGENGIIGTEEQDFFISTIEKFKNKKVVGPISADVVFQQAEQGKYSMIVALYHDQALIPFKLLHFNDGVNVTVGLPFLRTSPDHGTAFDIAGKNIASPEAMLSAIKFIINSA